MWFFVRIKKKKKKKKRKPHSMLKLSVPRVFPYVFLFPVKRTAKRGRQKKRSLKKIQFHQSVCSSFDLLILSDLTSLPLWQTVSLRKVPPNRHL